MDYLHLKNVRLFRGIASIARSMAVSFTGYIEILTFYLYDKPSYLCWKIINRDNKLELPCINPFTDVEIFSDGRCFLCCPRWLPHLVGNLMDDTIGRIFNSIQAQKIRISLYRGNLRYCKKNECMVLNSPTYEKFDSSKILQDATISDATKKAVLEKQIVIDSGPSRITENINENCNIRCNFCLFTYSKTDPRSVNKILGKYFNHLSSNLDAIKILAFCGGEPFLQKYVKEILYKCQGSDILFYFTSNINHISDELKKLLEGVNFYGFHCSINAATKKTYNAICGGNWDMVVLNLDYILNIRERKKNSFWVQISMVVTKDNYHEILEFCRFGLAKEVNKIIFYTMWESGYNNHVQLTKYEKDQIAKMINDDIIISNQDIIQINALKNFILNDEDNDTILP